MVGVDGEKREIWKTFSFLNPKIEICKPEREMKTVTARLGKT
jgi:hypothetical protein